MNDQDKSSEGRTVSEAWLRLFTDVSADDPMGEDWQSTVPGTTSTSETMRFKDREPDFWKDVVEEGNDYVSLTWDCCKCSNMFVACSPGVIGTDGNSIRWSADEPGRCWPPADCTLP